MKIYKDSNNIGDWVAMAKINGERMCAINKSKMAAMEELFSKIRWVMGIEEPSRSLWQQISQWL